MPEEEVKKVEEEAVKTVPIDTTGPDVEVDLPDETVKEAPAETPVTEPKEEPIKVEEVKEEAVEEKKDEKIEEYSEAVNKRIAKLTRRYRESERREKAALDYAAGAKREVEITRDQFQTTEEKYDKAFSEKVSEQIKSAQGDLASAIESGDAQKQVLANKKIAALSIEEARLNAAEKYRSETKPKVPDEQDHLRYRQTPQALPKETPPDPQAEEWQEKMNGSVKIEL